MHKCIGLLIPVFDACKPDGDAWHLQAYGVTPVL